MKQSILSFMILLILSNSIPSPILVAENVAYEDGTADMPLRAA